MRTHLLLLGTLCAASLGAQDYLRNWKTMADGSPWLEAPVIGTGSYFRTHFGAPQPRVELLAPTRLEDFVVGDHLELSLRGYLELVLANNTEVAIQKLSVETPKNAITRALARFDPTLTTTFRATRVVTPTSSRLEGATTLSQLTQPVALTYQQTLDTGTTYSVGFSGNKRSTNSAFATVNPSLNAAIDFSVTQPLIRNFGREVNRYSVMIAQSRYKQTWHTLQTQLLRLLATAENAYWAVVQARENLRVSEDSLKLNETLLKRAERELELGAISPLEIFQPQQNRANAEIFVTQARYSLQQAVDALRTQIGADLDPAFRNMPVTLTEEVLPPANEPELDAEQMVEAAYELRPDLKSTLENLTIDDLNFRTAKNQLLPDLSLSVSYSSAGLGGDVYEFGPGGTVVGVIPGGIGDALNQVFGFDFPTYGFTLSLRLPIRDRRSIADLADAVVTKKSDALRLQSLQQTIRLEVLNAVSQLESSKARVKLAQTALDFSQKRLDAEQKKYDLGVTTIFLLIQAQNDLTSAQSEVVTQASTYRRNLTNLLRVTGRLLEERGVVIQ